MRNKPGRALFIACLLMLTAFSAWAVEHPLADEAQEDKAEALFHEIRCTACQTESLAESPADVASEMRQIIRVRIAAGDSDKAIKAYLTEHYGKAIMLYPELTQETAIAWFGPSLLLIATLLIIWITIKRDASRNR